MLLILLGGIATAFNFIIILHKIRKGRITDSIIDLFSAIILGGMFVGTLTGMSIAMMASMFISIYLFFYPIDMLNSIKKWVKRKNKKSKF